MMTVARAALAMAGTAALSAALVLGAAGAAQAYPESVGEVDAVVFDNGDVVDLSREYLHLSDDLGTMGLASITPFDGGDGSATAWATVLTDVELLVIPEQEFANLFDTGGSPWLSEAAAEVVQAWVEAGNQLLLIGSWSGIVDEESSIYLGQAPLMSALLCFPVSQDELFTVDANEEFTLVEPLPGAPDPLSWRDGTYSLVSDAFSEALTGIATPIYVEEIALGGDEVIETVGAITFGLGDGYISYIAYDWWTETTSGDWYNVLQLAVSGEFPHVPGATCPPELAATGSEVPVAGIAAGAAGLALVGVVALVVIRRRATA